MISALICLIVPIVDVTFASFYIMDDMSASTYNFKKLDAQYIPERDITATLYEHIPTGARLMTLDNDDENKVFTVAFRTPVENSKGIPHILEHSVLQGSVKYPIDDIIAKIIKSSLASFINAMTYPDKTIYPIASVNTTDFFNLTKVYLDAAFHPLLTDNTLSREGWHYEIDPNTNELIYKGVVYNEMLGSYTNPYGEIFDQISSLVLPDTTYYHQSGGNPQVIPTLSHNEIREFHNKYYHPSNCYSFFYGNDHSDERFKLLDECFSKFTKQEIDSKITIQDVTKIPAHSTGSLINYSDETKGTTVKAILFTGNEKTEDTYRRYLEAYYLLGTSGSPLYQALKDSELGEEVIIGSPAMGLPEFDEIAQKWALFGLKNADINNFDAIHELITKTIEKTIQSIDRDNLVSALNTVEFNLRENDSGRYPQGMGLIGTILTTWLYDGDPFEAMRFEDRLNEIKQYSNDPEAFAANLKTYWLDYPHQFRVDLKPDPQAKKRWGEQIKERLQEAQSKMSEDQIDEIKTKQEELTLQQQTPDTPEKLALLPVLNVNDLEKDNETIPKVVYTIAGHQALYHEQNTHGIIYLEMNLDINHIPEDDLKYLPLFSQMLFETGTKNKSLSQLQFEIGMYTGGLGMSKSSTYSLDHQLDLWFDISLRCLPQNADKATGLIQEIIDEANINDRKILKQLINENRAGYESSFASNGMPIVTSSIASCLSPQSYLNRYFGGIVQFDFLRSIDTSSDNQIDEIIQAFIRLRSGIFTNKRVSSNITTTKDNQSKAEKIVSTLINNLPDFDSIAGSTTTNSIWNYAPRMVNKAYTTSGQVNFVGVGFKLEEYGYEPSGSMHVINNYLDMSYLWENIRLIGGAYGSTNSYSRIGDVYQMCSYRDPNILSSIETYKSIGHHLTALELTKEEIDKNIIGAIGDYDSHLLPHQKGNVSYNRYLLGITDEYLQKQRDQVLSTTIDDFRKTGEYLSLAADQSIIHIAGNKDQINKIQDQLNLEVTELPV